MGSGGRFIALPQRRVCPVPFRCKLRHIRNSDSRLEPARNRLDEFERVLVPSTVDEGATAT